MDLQWLDCKGQELFVAGCPAFFLFVFSIRCMRYIKLVFVHEASHTVNKDVHTAKLFQDLIHSSHDAVGLPHVDTQWKTAPP